MNAEDPLVVQIVRQLGDRLVEFFDLGPIDRVEEYRAEQPASELRAGVGHDVIRKQLGSDVAKFLPARFEKTIERGLVKGPEMAAVRRRKHDVAADEVALMPATPLQVEEIVAAVWEGSQQYDVGIHPQSAMLIKRRVAENVAKISNLRTGHDALEEASRHHVLSGPHLDPLLHKEVELLRRIAPHLDRMPGRPHRCGRGNQAVMLGGFG